MDATTKKQRKAVTFVEFHYGDHTIKVREGNQAEVFRSMAKRADEAESYAAETLLQNERQKTTITACTEARTQAQRQVVDLKAEVYGLECTINEQLIQLEADRVAFVRFAAVAHRAAI